MALVEAIARVQALVAERAPLQEVYDAVLDGCVALLHADSGSLRFVDVAEPDWMVAVAMRSCAGAGERWRQRSPVTEGASGRVIATGDLVAIEEYGRHMSAALSIARAAAAVDQAFTDSLTGLANRGRLLDRLEHELVRADRGGAPVTVLFLDLDRFKLINDSLGHQVGDRLLIEVARRLRRCTRAADTCARLGGDETVCTPRSSRDSASTASCGARSSATSSSCATSP